MNWLDPGFAVLKGIQGSVRTVGEPPTVELDAARKRRYEINRPKASRAAYFREYHKSNYATRRPYLTAKQAERRKASR
jgi:hypothetical protein